MTPYSFLSWNAQLNHRSSDPPALYCKPPAESFLPVACREGHKFRLSFRHSAQHITHTDCTEPRFTTTGRRKRREREGGRARGRAGGGDTSKAAPERRSPTEARFHFPRYDPYFRQTHIALSSEAVRTENTCKMKSVSRTWME